MADPIREGHIFQYNGSNYRREADDPNPAFECERIRVTYLSHPDYGPLDWKTYTFGAEPEWFKQRGLEVSQ